MNAVFLDVKIFLHTTMPFLAVFFLGKIAWIMWKHYVAQHFLSGIKWIVLEIRPPRDVLRSPRAMELFFSNALYQTTNKGWFEKYWVGAVTFPSSLEMASIGGQVHFYVRVPSRLKTLVETQMYAQYPQSEVIEVSDYAMAIDKISKDSAWNLWGCEFALEKPDPYPIKTYVDFGLDKDPKEEFKIDPLSPIIELFSSIEKDEQMWVQIVLRANKKEYHNHHDGTLHDFTKEVEEEMSTFMKDFTNTRDNGTKEIRPAPWQEPIRDGINKKVAKLTFECGIRVCYVAKKEAFQNNSRRNIRLIFRQYANPNMNSFMRLNNTQFENFWEYTDESLLKLKDRMLLEYQERAFFYNPIRHDAPIFWPISLLVPKYYHPHTFVLNVEELATIFHFPGQVLKVPGLERVESKESAPPTNLPM